MRVALVGAGSMAANHAKVIAGSDRAVLAVVVDRDADRAEQIARATGAIATTDLSRAFECDAAVIATATPQHADASFQLVDARLPVLVEKPLTPTLVETRRLVDTATANDVVLMCGLVERFNPAVARLAAPVLSGRSHIRTVRTGPAPERVHSSVVDDVLLHDLDIVLRLAGDHPVVDVRADAHEWCRCNGWPESVTCRLTFASGMTATLHASRVAAVKVRRYVITDDDGHQHRADLLRSRGNPLGEQFQRFVDLVRHGTLSEREAERQSVLPGHVLAQRIQAHLADTDGRPERDVTVSACES
jgi:predicted dehydrogenase